ncbi:hypothetical protein WR25_18106 [Diploscapter pachys]|uniref:ATP-dependent DNA helicase n=1 Tax=Diploscapter pachys TaxID=2018661 RepID=A0A2A2K553_9BILA|nr:hypothetical protein WR25_18106 [Diploscapter pachys]
MDIGGKSNFYHKHGILVDPVTELSDFETFQIVYLWMERKMMILAFEDLMQLPPVRLSSAPMPVSGRHMKSVFKTSPFTLRLWDLYDYAELTINMRQGEGSDYAKLLERILEKWQAEDPEVNVILEIPAETNEVEKAIGKKPFLQRGYRHIDVIRGEFGRKGRNHRQSAKDAKAAGGLESVLFLQKGCRIMQIQNDRSGQGTGIVNGSRGELLDFVMEDGKLDSLIVKFDHMDSPTRVVRVSTTYRTKNGRMWTRLQFPIVLAYAATIHKCQGMTVDNMMMDLYDCFSHGQACVCVIVWREVMFVYLLVVLPGYPSKDN